MQTKKTHWPSLIILITIGIGAAFLLLLSASFGIKSLVDLFTNKTDPAGQMIVAFAYGFELLILIACMWFVFQKTMGQEQANQPLKFPYAEWQIFAIIGIMALSVTIGAVVSYTEIAWLTWFILPVLTIFVIVPPIWLLFGVGTKGIELGPRWRVFSILGLGMTLGPVIMIVLELVILIAIIVISTVLIAVQDPFLFKELISVSKLIQNQPDPDQIFNLIAPYLKNPLVIGTAIGYIAVIVPLIEELLKPLAVWIFAKKLTSPAQGFAMGLLSGGAFALIESLNASSDGTVGWAAIVSIRAGTSLLHMTASGLVGWGIASAFKEKRVSRFFAAYLSSASIHGIWNACAAGIGISVVGESIGKPEWLANLAPALLCGMIVLGIGMFVVLIASNRKLQKSLQNNLLIENTEVQSAPHEEVK